ncbi:MAG: response regulator [Proteobacteria bacterium]|nr:response regulator [Pseudomonadota bacterium]
MKILITEDEPIVADELEAIITDLGHQVIGIAGSSRRALMLAQMTSCDLALVDVHLSDGITGPAVARHLCEETHATVIFTTSNPQQIPQDFSSACGIIVKPYSERAVKSAITFVVDCMQMGSSQCPKPRALELSPAYAARWKVGSFDKP